jgi:hypothetical protein
MSAIDILKLQLNDFFERSNQEIHSLVCCSLQTTTG